MVVRSRPIVLAMFLLIMGWLLINEVGSSTARENESAGGLISMQGVTVYGPVVPTLSPAVRDLPPYVIEYGDGGDINPRRSYDRKSQVGMRIMGRVDPLLEVRENTSQAKGILGFETPILNFDGQAYTGVNPPDTVGDVGPNHYIQMVNSGGGANVIIYDKAGNVVFGPFALDTLGIEPPCNSGYGDPIVLYDPLADRWLLSEFASSGNHLCVYISVSPDPTGNYYGYDFQTPNFPDYPKYAVWPDAYYVSSNESSPAAYALDRVKMLLGQPATAQRFTAPDLPGFPFEALTPSDLDGSTPPPAGAPNYFMRHRDTEVHGPPGLPDQDILEIWEFHVDFVNPGNSTFTGPFNIYTAEFDSHLCGLVSFSCFPQPGTGTQLDPLREVIMWRLQYRNFGSYETLVGNFVTDVDGTDHGGVRWFELRKSGAEAWTLEQEGTVAPDADNRWMGAISMDGSGNIALGYNVSSTSVYPSLRYIGRLKSDPPGTMPQGEYSLVAGTTYNGSNRYGDYSAMSVDPSDECTFWFTGEYNVNANHSWSTRIGVFKFDSCTGSLGPDFTLSATPETAEVCTPNDAIYDVEVGSVLGFVDPVTLNANGYPAGTTADFSVNPVTPPGNSILTIGNTGAAAWGSYDIDIVGVAPTSTHTTTVMLDVYTATPLSPSLISPSNGAMDQPLVPTFEWDESSQAKTYNLEASLTSLFEVPVLTATELLESTFTPVSPLEGGRCYWWHVRGVNACGAGGWSDTYHFATVALGVEFYDDIESGGGNWSHAATQGSDQWQITMVQAHSGTYAWHTPDSNQVTDTRLWITDPIQVGAGSTLTFWHQHQFEDNYDGAVLEISTDGGTNWLDLGPYMTANGYNGTISTCCDNPLGGRQAWISDLTPWTQVAVDLGSFAGQQVMIRWRFGADWSVSDTGWYIDDVEITVPLPANPAPILTSITPNIGFIYEDTPVEIEGSNFLEVVNLQLGYTWLISATVVSSTSIQAVVPAGMPTGVYSLTLYNGDCQMAVLPDVFTVIDDEMPIEGLEANNDSPTILGASTALTATVTSGTNPSFTWDFGDGESGGGDQVSHTYSAVGVYQAVVTATNTINQLSATTTVTITDVAIAGLDAVNDSPTPLGNPTTFTATLTAGSNPSFAWDFGDGSSGFGAVVTHTYNASGIYEVILTASNSVSTATANTSVEVTAPVLNLYLPLIISPDVP